MRSISFFPSFLFHSFRVKFGLSPFFRVDPEEKDLLPFSSLFSLPFARHFPFPLLPFFRREATEGEAYVGPALLPLFPSSLRRADAAASPYFLFLFLPLGRRDNDRDRRVALFFPLLPALFPPPFSFPPRPGPETTRKD